MKPVLKPLHTPRTMYPSELFDNPLDSEQRADQKASITPPPSYTEFLKAFSPIFRSPQSGEAGSPKFTFEKPRPSPITIPPSAASRSFSTNNAARNRVSSVHSPSSASTPVSAQDSGALRRLHIPPSLVSSPATASPQSAYTVRSSYSPSEWRRRYVESPRIEEGKPLVIRQVSSTTVTVKRIPTLKSPPEGKRKKTHGNRDSES